MIFFLLLIAAIIIKGISVSSANEFNKEYLSIENTKAVKGIFTLLIILSHSTQYISATGEYDKPYVAFGGFLGQMIVAMFMFYSGYGIVEAIAKKGFSYVKTMPTKRILRVLINFDFAVIIFLVLKLALGQQVDFSKLLPSLIAWENIGNSNWYIFAILVLYLLCFISYLFVGVSKRKWVLVVSTAVFTILTIGAVFAEMKIGKQSWFYNTMILFPLGCWYSVLKPYIEKLVMKNDIIYALISTVVVGGALYFKNSLGSYGIEGYSAWGIAFTLMIVLFTMKFNINSKILLWFGDHVFSVYMLQRVPMIILHHFGFSQSHKYMFIVITVVATIVIAQVFDGLTSKFWGIFDKNKRITAIQKEVKANV